MASFGMSGLWRGAMGWIVATWALTVSTGVAWAACAPDAIDLRGAWGQARFQIELADDAAERGQGLMFRENLPAQAGMLFVYDRPQHAAFWMKNTLIPLDMIFIDEAGVVTRVHENAVPGDLTAIPSEGSILAVLEINGGLSGVYGIGPGTEIRHPSLPQRIATWACEP